MPAVKGLSLIQPVAPAQLAKDTLRIYEICDGCRRCFNLCPSFNTLLDRIDVYETRGTGVILSWGANFPALPV